MALPLRRGGLTAATAVLLCLPASSLGAVPDGRIAYSCPQAVCTVLADGSDVRQVVKENTALFPAWSPDGGRIAYTIYGANRAIAVVNADGTGRKVLTHFPDVGAPAWSPDGKWIYFSGTRNLASGPSDVLYRLPSAGGTPSRVGLSQINSCGDGATLSDLDISAAGRILFSGARYDYGVGTGNSDPVYDPRIPHFQLYTVGIGGGAPALQTDNKEVDYDTPDWSPDGKSYVYWFQVDTYMGNASPKPACDMSSDYYKSSVNGIGISTGGAQRVLTSGPQDQPYGSPSWSLDGKQIAYQSPAGIVRRPASGPGQPVVVVAGASPDWGKNVACPLTVSAAPKQNLDDGAADVTVTTSGSGCEASVGPSIVGAGARAAAISRVKIKPRSHRLVHVALAKSLVRAAHGGKPLRITATARRKGTDVVRRSVLVRAR